MSAWWWIPIGLLFVAQARGLYAAIFHGKWRSAALVLYLLALCAILAIA